ncbi:MAG: DnaD domain protein [Peptococcaceae bacterium]|jgi:hypothetical protein|nr:DnaD domain protein [Peptococcaceae bacterium]
MREAEFFQFLQEKGQLAVPYWLLEKVQALDIQPEELGYLVLAMFQLSRDQRAGGRSSKDEAYPDRTAQGENPWVGMALEKGWAAWKGEGQARRVVFEPLWQKLYQIWEEEQKEIEAEKRDRSGFSDDFDYSRVIKELDRIRGSMSVTVREKQLIQEFNLKYGWSTDFILGFFRLCGMRDLTQMKNYKPLAASIHRSGIYTLDGLTSYMNEVDWIGKQAAEIKKDYLGLYGMVTVMERDYYIKWHITWKFSHGLIVLAARESAGAANATFKYIDTILGRWYDIGADTPEACEEAIRIWNEEKREAKTPDRQASGRISRRKPAQDLGVSPWDDVLEGDD